MIKLTCCVSGCFLALNLIAAVIAADEPGAPAEAERNRDEPEETDLLQRARQSAESLKDAHAYRVMGQPDEAIRVAADALEFLRMFGDAGRPGQADLLEWLVDAVRGAGRIVNPTDEADNASPYYWAAFTLSGDWR